MELKKTFNLKADLYNELRPTYSTDLYKDIFKYMNLNHSSDLLEIGIGTGQATIPFLEKRCSITAIELGKNLAELTAKKFKEYENLEVISSGFEDVELEKNSYDLIYSASAFHWIKPDIGLPKVYDALKNKGYFAWISTPPCAWKDNEKLFNKLQEVYYKYGTYFGAKAKLTLNDVDNKIKNDTKYKEDVLREYKFKEIYSNTYIVCKTFTSDDYIRLIDTYSDHSVIPNEDKQPFYSEIKDTIDDNGGIIEVTYTNVLVLGRK